MQRVIFSAGTPSFELLQPNQQDFQIRAVPFQKQNPSSFSLWKAHKTLARDTLWNAIYLIMKRKISPEQIHEHIEVDSRILERFVSQQPIPNLTLLNPTNQKLYVFKDPCIQAIKRKLAQITVLPTNIPDFFNSLSAFIKSEDPQVILTRHFPIPVKAVNSGEFPPDMTMNEFWIQIGESWYYATLFVGDVLPDISGFRLVGGNIERFGDEQQIEWFQIKDEANNLRSFNLKKFINNK
jgi:hypothetical protein